MARGTVNVNMHTTYGPAPGQVGNAEVRNVGQTLPKPSADLQIPGAASVQPYRCGAPLPMAMSRWMEEWGFPGSPKVLREQGWCIVIYCCHRSAANYWQQRGS